MKINFKNIAMYISGLFYLFAGAYSALSGIWNLPHTTEVVMTSIVVGTTVSGIIKLFTAGALVDSDNNGIPDILENKEE